MDCLRRQEAAALGKDSKPLMKRDTGLVSDRNAAAVIGDRGGQPIRNKARAVKAVAAVNSTNMVCNGRADFCEAKLPKWLHWLCGAFSSTCEVTEQFCLGWEQICTSSVEVCELWGSTCEDIIPDWAILCLWENQPGHSVAQQLADGIRFLDLGTCLTKNNTEVVMCHGNGGLRALGHPLDSILTQILDFMNANPYEVITVEFNENDGDITKLSRMIVEKILKTFRQPEMILANQRIMLFFGDTYHPIPDPKPAWANHKDTWKLDGFQYTSTDTTPAQLNQSYYEWCAQGPPTDGSYIRWQQIDINMAILKEDIISSIKKGQIPQLCIGPLAKETNSAMLDAISEYCYGRWPYWFRVRVNDYWEGNVFKAANLFNDRNVARVKAGDTITPY
ncbi:hypothetical protein BGZ70_004753 [Mortierella alpina]|uniref:PLC-like phosphodiesterase n=1 Tax=Mortierella alpina TaxID=64518 RepID=A0A9P6M722_MORAP|nr:hypothetical protein BGZ70_004753 [Mortierella alpina]